MPDAYTPKLTTFVLTAAERAAVAAAMLTAKPWDWKPDDQNTKAALVSVKAKIRDLHLKRHNGRCCYCRKLIHGEGRFAQDREHILPKSKPAYKAFCYEIWNLGVSCKTCNMEIKGNRIDFVVDKINSAQFQIAGNYLIVHPNFDHFEDHLRRFEYGGADKSIVKFSVKHGSIKGPATRDYFRLTDREVDSFDKSQGLQVENVELGIAIQVRTLAEKWAQPPPSLPAP